MLIVIDTLLNKQEKGAIYNRSSVSTVWLAWFYFFRCPLAKKLEVSVNWDSRLYMLHNNVFYLNYDAIFPPHWGKIKPA